MILILKRNQQPSDKDGTKLLISEIKELKNYLAKTIFLEAILFWLVILAK